MEARKSSQHDLTNDLSSSLTFTAYTESTEKPPGPMLAPDRFQGRLVSETSISFADVEYEGEHCSQSKQAQKYYQRYQSSRDSAKNIVALRVGRHRGNHNSIRSGDRHDALDSVED